TCSVRLIGTVIDSTRAIAPTPSMTPAANRSTIGRTSFCDPPSCSISRSPRTRRSGRADFPNQLVETCRQTFHVRHGADVFSLGFQGGEAARRRFCDGFVISHRAEKPVAGPRLDELGDIST